MTNSSKKVMLLFDFMQFHHVSLFIPLHENQVDIHLSIKQLIELFILTDWTGG
jgi:predicted transcriptional regulator